MAAAALLGVPAEPMLTAEEGSAFAFEQIGAAAGAFPWWDALELPWPGSVGTEL